jgi:hypothetical protein
MTRQLFVPVLFVAWLTANTAFADNDQSWLSSTGTGIACTRVAPCSSFIVAHAATVPNGVISVVDSGDYGTVTITKSLTIRADGVDAGSSTGFVIGARIVVQAGASDVVTLEGLHLNAASGVDFRSGGQLHVVRSFIGNGGSTGIVGIKFEPNSPGKLSVTDSVIANMGSGTGGGIVVSPRPGGSAEVNLERVTINGNAFGIAVDGSNSTNGINMTVADSMVGGNAQDGILATTPGGGAPIGVLVTGTKSVNNSFGLRSIGSNVTIRAESSKIAGNGTGLSFSGGGALLSAGNNLVEANGANGAFSGSVALK